MGTMVSVLAWCSGLAAGFVASAWLTGRLATMLVRAGVLDAAGTLDRGRPIPRGGGLAIVAVVVAAGLFAGATQPQAAPRALAALALAVAVAAVSWRDDVRPLPATVRLTCHFLAAAAAVAVLGCPSRIELIGLDAIEPGPLGWPLAVLWIVGMTNAFNFMDGSDGRAGITALAAAGTLAAAAALLHAPAVAIVAGGLAAAAAGFLTGNWPPAKIFMGDVGSTFCGFVLAVLPLAVEPAQVPRCLPLAALPVWPFAFDTSLSIARRILRRENLLRPHRCHLYQRLVAAGWSHRAVARLYGGLAAFSGAIAVAPLLEPGIAREAAALAVATPLVGGGLLAGLAAAAERGPDRGADRRQRGRPGARLEG